MVDVGTKPVSERVAVARAAVHMRPETLRLIHSRRVAKGDALAAARIAGIMAAKRTSELIPLCHPLQLEHVDATAELEEAGVVIRSSVVTTGKTGETADPYMTTIQWSRRFIGLKVFMALAPVSLRGALFLC